MPKLRRPPSMPKPRSMPTSHRSPLKKTPTQNTTAKQPTSGIEAHEYCSKTGCLTVTYKGGRQYRYAGMDEDTARKFADAPSKGSFLHSSIIGKFDTTKI